MARALSDDLRERVLQASTDGSSAWQSAARFGGGISTAIRWIARTRLGETKAQVQGRRRTSRLDAHEAFIVGLLEERRDITLNEMMSRLSDERSVVIGHSALSAWLRSRGWSFKKSPPMHWSRSVPTSEAVTGLVRDTARSRSRTPCFRRRDRSLDQDGPPVRSGSVRRALPSRDSHGHRKTTTFAGALRLSGMTAPFVYDSAMNGAVFLAYVEQVLVPTLRPVGRRARGDRTGWRDTLVPAAL